MSAKNATADAGDRETPDANQTSATTSAVAPLAVLGVDDVPEWHVQANCLGVDPDLFFPERGASTKEAKAVCAACAVRIDCLEYAIANVEKHGIWGGTSEKERRTIRRDRARAIGGAA